MLPGRNALRTPAAALGGRRPNLPGSAAQARGGEGAHAAWAGPEVKRHRRHLRSATGKRRPTLLPVRPQSDGAGAEAE
eukprot:5788624-Pleurochrysis_carterae.AAC.2